jgi:plastocyanin
MAGHGAKRRRLFLAAAVAALAALGAWAAIALAAEDVGVDPVCCQFDKATFAGDEGETSQLITPAGADSSHNVTARDKLGGKPLFRSRTIGKGKSALIDGLQYLTAGSYKFNCSIHPDSMKGTFVISGKGTPVARPKINVSVPAQTLNRVRGSGKLKVKVKAITRSVGISIEARKGAKLIGKASGLTLAAGKSRTVKVALTAKGRKALRGVNVAAVSATGSAPFGLPDSGRRTLR